VLLSRVVTARVSCSDACRREDDSDSKPGLHRRS
jgi:hypothetical protein